MYELRNYQNEAIDTIKQLPVGKPGLIALPTGSGKGILLSFLASQVKGRSLIVVPSKELREDMLGKLKNIDNTLDVGSVQASLDEVQSKIVIATRQSLTHHKSNRVERMLDHGEFELIIFDEAHQAVHQIQKILEKIDISKSIVFGLTATPYNPEMFEIFEKINYYKDILWMIDNQYLVEPKVLQINTKVSLSGVRTIAGEFNQKDLENTVNTDYRNDLIVKGYKEYASDRKHTLVFASGISHSTDLANEFKSNGISCESIDSTLSQEEREKVLANFKSGKTKVLCNVSVLTTGFDFQPIDCIILARPTKSKILFTQILGRGLRLAKNKTDCLVLDFKDAASSHDIMDMENIFGVPFKNGETLKDARDRVIKEKEAYEDELRRREEERQKQIEIIAEQIKLFNREMDRAFADVYYDWFKVKVSTWVVSESSDIHYAVDNINDEFIVYEVITAKERKHVEELNIFKNITEAVQFVEENIKNPKSFAFKGAAWKNDIMTEKQRQYCKYGRTKFDAHKFFTSNNIKWQLKNYQINNA